MEKVKIENSTPHPRKKFHRAVPPPSENTATVVYSHCTNRFEHHTL